MNLSIITAVFNRADCVGQAVNSVQQQIYPDVEHVVIDGASTDGTLEILQNCLDASATLVSEPDKGIYDALNKGLNRASGDLIGMHIILLDQLCHGKIPLAGSQCHFGFEIG